MNEHILGSTNDYYVFNDKGIYEISKKKILFFPYGSMKSASVKTGWLSTDLKITFDFSLSKLGFRTLMFDKKYNDKIVQITDFIQKAINNAEKETVSEIFDELEFYKKCNVCGSMFCYNTSDIRNNKKNSSMATLSSVGSAVGALGSRIDMYGQGAMADKYNSRIVDFNKCPQCGSSQLTILTKEELEEVNTKSTETQNNQTTYSAADEIKKFKDLLDSGIITQEEFDEKKKQLLNL